MKETDLTRGGLLNFQDFFDISYSVDGNNEVYPDVYDTFEKQPNSDKKKLKK